jgi:hypothetical protein
VAVKNAASKEKPYKLADGAGLYIEVMPNSSKYWRLKYRFGGKEKRLALGVYPATTLKAARNASRAARSSLADGNPRVGSLRGTQDDFVHERTPDFAARLTSE